MATVRRPPGRDERARRTARWTGAAGLGIAAALPAVLWHDVVADVAASSHWDATAVAGWVPWVLMTLGLACAIPIWVEDLRDRERRFHRRGTAAWAGWGITLYLLGFALATQVAQIHALHAS
jgi:hypothetical protein